MPKKKGFPLKLESIFTSMFGIYSYHLENWMNLNSKKNSWILIMFFPSLRNCQLEDETQELPWLAMVFLYLIHFKTDFYSVKSKIGIYSLWSPEILEVAGALTHSWPSVFSWDEQLKKWCCHSVRSFVRSCFRVCVPFFRLVSLKFLL